MLQRLSAFVCVAVAWGVPATAGNAPGIKNFDQVDAHVYRGAQPTSEGLRYLASLGVKAVIDLREADGHAKAEESMVTKSGMAYLNVPMSGLTPPTEAELRKILPVLENASGGPVFVHCWRGADRTGAVIAAYHIDHDRWDNARALKDAKAHGMGFLQIPRLNFIKDFGSPAMKAQTAAEGGASAVIAVTTTP